MTEVLKLAESEGLDPTAVEVGHTERAEGSSGFLECTRKRE